MKKVHDQGGSRATDKALHKKPRNSSAQKLRGLKVYVAKKTKGLRGDRFFIHAIASTLGTEDSKRMNA